MINPSAVNLFSLPSVSLNNRFDLPMTPAVYLAIDTAGKVKYVGRTKSLWRRWNTAKHHRYNQLHTIGEIQIAWIEISDPKLLPEIEKALIAWFKPPLNGTRIERANTENKFPVEYLSERLTQTAQLLKVFRQYGYEGATLARLSKATGLGKASLYHHFPNGKEEMAAAVLNYIDDWTATKILAPLQDSGAPADRIRAMCKSVDEFYHRGQQACLFAVLSLGDAKDLFHVQIEHTLEAWIDALAQVLIEAGIERSLARQRAEDAILQIQGALVLARGLNNTAPFQRVLQRLPDDLLIQ